MYWKKKPPPNTSGINLKNQPPLDDEHDLPTSRYEMSNRKQLPFTSRTPASMKTTALDKEKDEDGPLYECTDPMEGYAEMS